MKYPNDKREFDLGLVLGLGLIALAPLLFVVLSNIPRVVNAKRKEPVSHWETPAPLQPTMQQDSVVPVEDISPLPPTPTPIPIPRPQIIKTFNPRPPLLSPDGLYAATREQGMFRAPNAYYGQTPQSQLVILRVSDRKEVARHLIDYESTGKMRWSRDGSSFAGVGRFAQVWNRASPDGPGLHKARSGFLGGHVFDSDSAAYLTYLNFESDVVVQFLASGVFTASRISTRKPIPIRP